MRALTLTLLLTASLLPLTALSAVRPPTRSGPPAATTRPAQAPARLYGEKPADIYPENVPPPIIRDKFTADPHITVYGDTYYIYPTVDKENWRTTEFMVWSSKNLIDWKNEGIILDVAGREGRPGDVSWGKISAWAPAAISRNGKYYFYYAVEQAIGVGVADTPAGPFKDLGKPLIAKGVLPGSQSIDVFVMTDDDGQAYLYVGQGNLWAYKLKQDMMTLDSPPMLLTPTWTGGGRFNEGVVVFKRKGTYYFMWSENDARSPDYRIGWGTAKSALGPIDVAPQADRIVIQKSGLVVGTGHHSVLNVPGTDRWYAIYHRHAVPGGNGFIRETCLSLMEFEPNPNGGPDKIKPVNVTKPAFPPGSKGEPLPAQ